MKMRMTRKENRRLSLLVAGTLGMTVAFGFAPPVAGRCPRRGDWRERRACGGGDRCYYMGERKEILRKQSNGQSYERRHGACCVYDEWVCNAFLYAVLRRRNERDNRRENESKRLQRRNDLREHDTPLEQSSCTRGLHGDIERRWRILC